MRDVNRVEGSTKKPYITRFEMDDDTATEFGPFRWKWQAVRHGHNHHRHVQDMYGRTKVTVWKQGFLGARKLVKSFTRT